MTTKTKKPKAPKVPERQFRVSFEVGERKVGTLIADFYGMPGFAVSPIIERPTTTNAPTGAFRDVFLPLLKKGPQPRPFLMQKMEEAGFAKSVFHSQIAKMLKEGVITRKGTNGHQTVQLKKGA